MDLGIEAWGSRLRALELGLAGFKVDPFKRSKKEKCGNGLWNHLKQRSCCRNLPRGKKKKKKKKQRVWGFILSSK